MPTSSSTHDRKTYMQAFRERQKLDGHTRATVNLSPDEYRRLAANAERHGQKIATHVKHLALANLDRRYLLPPDTNERLDALIAIMRGIGNNLNQLARHSNEMRYFLDTEEVRLQVKHMEEAVRQFVAHPPTAEG